jgi:hypothetical protein
MRTLGWLCIVAGIQIAIITPAWVRAVANQRLEYVSPMPGFLIAMAVTGFGILLLALRPPRK